MPHGKQLTWDPSVIAQLCIRLFSFIFCVPGGINRKPSACESSINPFVIPVYKSHPVFACVGPCLVVVASLCSNIQDISHYNEEIVTATVNL